MSNALNLSKLGVLAAKLISIVSADAHVPTGSVFDYALNTAPAGYILCDGSLLGPATPYANLRAALIADGFPHGSDGAGNPRIPDAKGRVTAGKDNMGGTAAGRLTAAASGVNGAVLGAVGGAEVVALTQAQMPSHNHGVNDPGHGHTTNAQYLDNGNGVFTGNGLVWRAGTVNPAVTGISIQFAGSSQAHNNTQPTLVLNKIIKT